jgi:hypothetical protein
LDGSPGRCRRGGSWSCRSRRGGARHRRR